MSHSFLLSHLGAPRRGFAVWAAAVALLITSGCFGSSTPEITRDEPLYSHPFTLLKDSMFRELIVEIDYVKGYKPSELALAALRSTLEQAVQKDTIRFEPMAEIPAQNSPYSGEDLQRIRLNTFDSGHPSRPYGANGSATLHILYLNGVLQEPALGLYAFGIFVLPDEIRSGGPFPNLLIEKHERSVLIHELGHAFGLVNAGIPMLEPREDPNSPHHSTRPESVMYSGFAGTSPFPKDLVMDPTWTFDEYDWADIRTYQRS